MTPNSESSPEETSALPPGSDELGEAVELVSDAIEKGHPAFNWAVPEELGIPADQLRLRLDFFHQATEMTYFEDETVTSKIVSALDVAHALASELSFGSGLLPPGTIWWRNTNNGAVVALYVEKHIRQVALQLDIKKEPRRYKIPMPGLIFLCQPGETPWVFAVKHKPKKETDIVYRAPLANIHANGRSCAGTHKYPTRLENMVESFFISFFSATADLHNRSKQFPENVIHLWEFLNGKKKYPLADLVEHGTISDLLNMGMN
ncbi:hypothetical protein LCGC14_1934420 [marine sediment metagenome]|uniref:PRTRC system protein B n=1 Tax=marine sediment metagenome TaxID=412755 RepID=A0A0F9IJP0_9ZZZZ